MTLIVRGRANAVVYELISGTAIPRTRNFYRKDHVGFYYVPEVRLPNA